VVELATGLIAAVEGGYLLGQVAHSSVPVATSIDVALSRVETYVVQPWPPEGTAEPVSRSGSTETV
jgi:hypothetical protein